MVTPFMVLTLMRIMGGANGESRHACIFVPVRPGLVAHVTRSNAGARRVDVTARIDAWNMLISCVIRRHGAGPAGMIMGGRRVVTRGLRLPRLAMRTAYWVTRNTVSPLASSMAATHVTSSNRKDLGCPFRTACPLVTLAYRIRNPHDHSAFGEGVDTRTAEQMSAHRHHQSERRAKCDRDYESDAYGARDTSP
jgi:hypothetical protein